MHTYNTFDAMNILAVIPSKYEISGFVKEIIYEFTASGNISIISLDANKEMQSIEGNTLYTIKASNNSHLGNWLANKLRYQQIIKKFKISKILLLGQYIPIDSELKQYLIYSSNTQLTEKEKASLSNKNVEFITYSQEEKNVINKIFSNKTIHFFLPKLQTSFKPLNWEETLDTKGKYTDGEEFFLVNEEDISTDEAVYILKGFSIFKKWQHSNMKMLFLTSNIAPLQEKIANYKYREDIRLVNNPDEDERATIIASAYSALHIPNEDSNTQFAIQAIQCHIPILAKSTATISNWLQNNVFLIPDDTIETLGQAFITMYKAENIRARFVEYYQTFVFPSSDNLSFLLQ